MWRYKSIQIDSEFDTYYISIEYRTNIESNIGSTYPWLKNQIFALTLLTLYKQQQLKYIVICYSTADTYMS
jgi:hypothetical protein